MALNAQRVWTTALNAEWKTNNSFECRNWETMVALNAKTGEVALNAELKVWHDDSEWRKQWMNGGSERQTARKRWEENTP